MPLIAAQFNTTGREDVAAQLMRPAMLGISKYCRVASHPGQVSRSLQPQYHGVYGPHSTHTVPASSGTRAGLCPAGDFGAQGACGGG
jgi:hypothetical protein